MDWVVDFEEKLGELETSQLAKDWKKRSIYKVSPCAKERNEKAYIPQAVSFGPYHHEEQELQMQMEFHKRRALHHFLKKSKKPLQTYVNALKEVVHSRKLVQELMDSYDSLDTSYWHEEKFLQLMLLDGCFMIEILRANEVVDKRGDTYGNYGGVEDPIFSYHGKVYVMPYIRRDMLMLENQLPMMLLKKLVTVEATVTKVTVNQYLNGMIFKFINPQYSLPSHITDCLHILDLYRKSLLGLTPAMLKHPDTKPKGAADIVRSAVMLHEAGIGFRTSATRSIMDISFDRGVLKLPTIIVDDATESTFLNLIAFERLHVGAGNEVTSFVFFMDNIIDSAKDVAILHSEGIIRNAIGSEKAIANLFNGLSKDLTPDPEGILEKVHDDLDRYCKRKLHYWRASVKRNPWACFSLCGALLVILLIAAQTIYAIIAYHHPKDKNSPPPPSSRFF